MTSSRALRKYHFDTADSSTWSGAGRFGKLYFFKEGHMVGRRRIKGMRMKDWKRADIHNLKQFLKYQEYAENHL